MASIAIRSFQWQDSGMTDSGGRRNYHHGDLRAVLLRAAVDIVGETGPAAMSFREVARRAGVSHTAAGYHFGDKSGLLTAIAVEGYELLASSLAEVWEQTDDFLEVGVAYVRFALAHRAHFDVMFQPGLLNTFDPALEAARGRARQMLYHPAAGISGGPALEAGIAAWSLMHGLATLWRNGALPEAAGDDAERLARAIGRYLFTGPPPSASSGVDP